MKISKIQNTGYEYVASCKDEGAQYHGLIAIHSTTLGPALGGTRLWNYRSEGEALWDLLRLARGMTYKNALAGIPFGGGKSVIIATNGVADRERLFRAHGRFIQMLSGNYITAEDIGSTTIDMDYVGTETQYVAGLNQRSGDPSPSTARGVVRAIQAAAKFRWGSDLLSGRSVAIQGCGNVGYHLASFLHNAGVHLVVSDVVIEKAKRVVREFGARSVAPDQIHSEKVDIFAPCGLGATINEKTVSLLQAEIVAGSANNQLLSDHDGNALEERGIVYVPDFAASAGGVINGCIELLGWQPFEALRKVDEIYDTVLSILKTARNRGIRTYQAANELAEARLSQSGPTKNSG